MNLRRRKPHDSLYMLLDTMCNAFGGIILLAVLVVLLTSKEKIQSATSADSTSMLQRRVALAQTNLQQSLQLAASLQTQAGDDRWKAQVPLLATRQQLEGEIKQIRELAAQNAQQLDANAGSDFTGRLKQLNTQIAQGDVKKLTMQNSIEAAKDERKTMTARLRAAERQMDEIVKFSQRELRLPKEHDTERQVVYAIVIFGRVYVCRNADMTRNEIDIHWTDKMGVEYADPRKNKGWDPITNESELRAYFTAQAHNSVYVDFVATVDSFPAFIRAKQLAVESNLPYGWIPWRVGVDGDLSFSAMGTTPLPQ